MPLPSCCLSARITYPQFGTSLAIAHELTHAEHPNHGPRFWRLVAQHVPDYEEKNKWLKENSPRLVYSKENW